MLTTVTLTENDTVKVTRRNVIIHSILDIAMYLICLVQKTKIQDTAANKGGVTKWSETFLLINLIPSSPTPLP